MSNVQADELRRSLIPAVEAAGLLLEDVTTAQAGRRTVVRVTVDLPDGPGGVTSDQLADATRAVSEALDRIDPVQGTYTLEVSTPGIERPLTEARHFRRAVGRLVEFETAEGTRSLRLTGVEGEELHFGETQVALPDVVRARMIVDFGAAKKE